MKNNYWKNKNIVITGGTSGLGKAMVETLYPLGANIIVVARRQELLDRVKAGYPKVKTFQADVSDKEAIHPLAGSIFSYFKKVDLLFNIASYLGSSPLKLFMDTECEDFEDVLQTNLLGPFRLTKLVASQMILAGSGMILNISSDAAINPYPTWGSYSVSKAAIDHMSRIFDEELKESGVRFLSVDPGDMATPMHFAAVPDAKPEDLRLPETSALLIKELIESEDYSSVRRSV